MLVSTAAGEPVACAALKAKKDKKAAEHGAKKGKGHAKSHPHVKAKAKAKTRGRGK